jgi:hypothetical protein
LVSVNGPSTISVPPLRNVVAALVGISRITGLNFSPHLSCTASSRSTTAASSSADQAEVIASSW